jgi:phosphoribosylformylglycinamidine cyclo-ligase
MEAGPIDRREAYATFNMGVGFAAYVAPSRTSRPRSRRPRRQATTPGSPATCASKGARKAVVVPSLDLTFEGDTLQVR